MTVSEIIIRYREAFFGGLLVTLSLASIAWAAGLIIGTAVGVCASRFRVQVGYPLHALSFFLAAVPPIIVLYWAHYPLQAALNVVINPFITAATVLSAINIVIVAEIIRAALDNFRVEYLTAAQVAGMSRREILRWIQLPLIVREVAPSILASQVLILQSTLFASLISVEELFRVAQRINAAIYQPIQIYTALAAFFLVVCLPVYAIAYFLRRRFVRDISER